MEQLRKNEGKNVAHRVHSRKIDRAVAKYVAKRMGLRRLTDHKRNRYMTKKDLYHGRRSTNEHYSTFSQRWRELSERIA